jgi:enoyl-CoA hydratase/carnithine racemase
MAERVSVHGADGVSVIVFREPGKRNAFTPALVDALLSAIDAVASDRERILAVVLHGADGVFSSGADLDHLNAMSHWEPGQIEAWIRRLYRGILQLRELPAVTIAAVNGPAIGAGLGLALACDLRIAGRTARFAAPFLRLGFYPGMGLTYLLTHLLGPSRALELLCTGRVVGAIEAYRLGLVNKVVAPDRTLPEAEKLARSIAAGPPIPLRRLKYGIEKAALAGLAAALEDEIEVQLACYATTDFREGLAALRERRPPRFAGR